jgi:DNA polymerase IV
VLKLKAARFALRTRSARLSSPTILPGRLFDLARSLLAKEANGIDFRLTGIGASLLVPGSTADLGDWAGLTTPRRAAAIDALRGRFGESAISRVRSLR